MRVELDQENAVTTKMQGHRPFRKGASRLLLALAALAITGCEVDSFMDPSVVGRWERTPVTLPILERLDVIDEPDIGPTEITGVRAADHVPDTREYVLGPGDVITVTIFELIRPGEDAVQTRRIDELGRIRLPLVGGVDAAGMSPSQLEQHIAQMLEQEGVLRDAVVSVIIQQARQNTFSVLGEPATGGTAIGTYSIPEPDFRLLDALAMARGVPGRTKRLLIYRQAHLVDEATGEPIRDPAELPDEMPEDDPEALIEQLLEGVDQQRPDEPEDNDNAEGDQLEPVEPEPGEVQQPSPRHAPPGLQVGLERDRPAVQWVHVDGEWVRTEVEHDATYDDRAADPDELSEMVTQRIIEVPYQRLLEGDMRYNIVIRPGDVIRVPAPSGGFVYAMGAINRPGAYTVPGERDLTLMQLVASGGNLSAVSIPERVDIVRRIGDNQQAIVRVNVRAIFDGTEPDIFLKPNDLINFGTSFWATPLAIVRNGFRATYGFGFVLDRNFGPDVFD